MSGRKLPTAVVEANGKKHFTKAELEERKDSEVKAPSDKVKPPTYLDKQQKKKFKQYMKELLAIELLSNLDCDSLARYVIAESQYLKISAEISKIPYTIEVSNVDEETGEMTKKSVVNPTMQDLLIMQDRCFKQCRQGASDFGLTVTSRCRLVVPKPKETKKNKFEKYAAHKGKA